MPAAPTPIQAKLNPLPVPPPPEEERPPVDAEHNLNVPALTALCDASAVKVVMPVTERLFTTLANALPFTASIA